MSFLDSLAGYAPYVAPIIERHRQRDLQTMMLQQQNDEQKKKDDLAAAASDRAERIGQSTIGRNNASAEASRATATTRLNPAPKPFKVIPSQEGKLYRIYQDGTWEEAPEHTPSEGPPPSASNPVGNFKDFLKTSVASRDQFTPGIPSAPTQAGTPSPNPPQQVTPPVAANAPKFGPRAPLPKPVTPGPLTTATNGDGRAYRARVAPNGVITPLMTAQGDTAFVPKPAAKPVQGSFGTVTVGGENGVPGTIKAFDRHTGKAGEVLGNAPQRSPGGLTGGMGAGGIGGVARTAAAITGMEQAEPLMTAFENDPNRQLGGLDYWQKMRAGMYDAKGIKDEAAHAAVYSHLNQTNPGLANYLRNAETWALEDSQLSGKASDFRLKLDGFISQIGPNADEAQRRNTQTFRKTRLAELLRFRPAMQAIGDRIAGGGGRGAKGATPVASDGQSVGGAPGGNLTGDINLGAPPSPAKATATPQPLERAKTDSLYARFLKDTGKMPP